MKAHPAQHSSLIRAGTARTFPDLVASKQCVKAPVRQLGRDGHVEDCHVHVRLGRSNAIGAVGRGLLLRGLDVEIVSRPLEELHSLWGVAVDGNDNLARHGGAAVERRRDRARRRVRRWGGGGGGLSCEEGIGEAVVARCPAAGARRPHRYLWALAPRGRAGKVAQGLHQKRGLKGRRERMGRGETATCGCREATAVVDDAPPPLARLIAQWLTAARWPPGDWAGVCRQARGQLARPTEAVGAGPALAVGPRASTSNWLSRPLFVSGARGGRAGRRTRDKRPRRGGARPGEST